jgi:predicted dithiol-disulfide oxidoreductase (DUF899 family)
MPHAPDIAKLEQDVHDAKRRLKQALRELPHQPLNDYQLRHVPSGSSVALSALFGSHTELLVVHNMGKRCPYCTLWADGFASMYKHLANRCAFVLATPDLPDVAGAFASARGWTFPVVSCEGSTFAHDMGYQGEESTFGSFRPGISAFAKLPHGALVRTGTRVFGPGDDFCSLWPMFDLLRDGDNDWQPKYHY